MTFSDTRSASTAVVETILVVEDEVLIRMVISEYLRECGYRVIEAANADEAVVVLKEPAVTIEVVLSDVQMPGSMDGFGLSQWVRQHRQGLEVILVGSPARAADAAADLCESGPMLSKPYEPQVVVDRIRRLLGERASRKKISAPRGAVVRGHHDFEGKACSPWHGPKPTDEGDALPDAMKRLGAATGLED